MSTIPQALRARRPGVRCRRGDRRRRRAAVLRQLLDEVRAFARLPHRVRRRAGRPRRASGRRTRGTGSSPRSGVHYAGATLVPINTRYTGHEALDILQRTPRERSRRRRAVPRAPTGWPSCARWPRPTGCPTCASSCASRPTIPPSPTTSSTGRTSAPVVAVPLADVDRARRRGRRRGRQRHPVHVRHDRTQQGRAVSAHRQALDVARAWAACGEVDARDRYLVINPFFHSFGYKAGILVCLLTGATIVPMAAYDVEARDAPDPGRADHRAARARRRSTRPSSTTRRARRSTCRRCGSRSPAPPSSRWRWSSGCRPRWASTSCSPRSG